MPQRSMRLPSTWGYDFFRDRDTLKTRMMQADVFALGDNSALGKLVGTFDFIHEGMVFHLFTLDKQRELLMKCVKLLKPQPGTLILGQAVGDAKGTQKRSFRHNGETFKKLCGEVSAELGVKFDCRAFVDQGLGISDKKRTWDDPNTRRLAFEVERLED